MVFCFLICHITAPGPRWRTLNFKKHVGSNTIITGFIHPNTSEVSPNVGRLGTGFCIFWMTYLSQNWQGWGAVFLTRQVWVMGSW